jgi:glycosyltransferase involved in cell wall biosynthesis
VKIAYYSIDEPEFACAQLRVLRPLGLLAPEITLARGVEITIHGTGNSRKAEYLVDTELARAADLVLVQRGFPLLDLPGMLDSILGSGRPVVYETDDDLRIIPESHDKPMYRAAAPRIAEFAQRANLITVATSHLGERFSSLNRATVVLPNCLPQSLWKGALDDRNHSARLTIGYCGTKGHEPDLRQVEDALIETSRRYPGLQLVFLGCITERLSRLPRARFIAFDGDYRTWPRRLASAGIDIAVVPLEESAFNNCKSHIKFLELGYLGIPGIFSDVAPYRDTVEHGATGLLAGPGTEAWLTALERLISDEAARRNIGANASRAVTQRHLLENHSGRWLEAYRGLL